MSNDTHDVKPDQFAEGVTFKGEKWSIARYDALLVYVWGEHNDDEQFDDAEDAETAFDESVADMARVSRPGSLAGDDTPVDLYEEAYELHNAPDPAAVVQQRQERPFTCSLCPHGHASWFGTERELAAHIRDTHAEEN